MTINQKIIAIHQPNFLPWLGYFWKLAHCDGFILLDDCQFSNNSYTNRTRIKTANGAKWITVPVQRPKLVPINKLITGQGEWRKKIWQVIKENYSKSPYFKEYENLFESGLNYWEVGLANYNIHLIEVIRKLLGIDVIFLKSSVIKPITNKAGCERIVELVQAIGGNVYLSGFGARSYNEAALFQSSGIELQYTNFEHPVYLQPYSSFDPGLSIIDALFNCGTDEVRRMLGIV